MRISYQNMKNEFQRILMEKGFEEQRAEEAAKMFADTSADGVYSHGYLRFPRVIEYIEKGYINVQAVPEKVAAFGAAERWDGHLGMGNLNAKMAMDRAIELAKQFGIGMVAICNTNHWMRGGTYGWQVADALIAETLEDIRSSVPDHEGGQVRYPGESTVRRRRENMELGIPVKEEIWNLICRM